MFYGIIVDGAGNITSWHAGSAVLKAPWIAVTKAQFAAITPGSKWVNNGVVAPTATVSVLTPAEQLAAAQAAQDTGLTGACAKAISAGFISSALGAPHSYGSTGLDQRNIDAGASAAFGAAAGWQTPEWCADSTGKWLFIEHTAAQIIQVQHDMQAMISAARTKLAALKASVATETTVAAVQAITW